MTGRGSAVRLAASVLPGLVLASASLLAVELPEEWSTWRYVRDVAAPANAAVGELLSISVPEELYAHVETDFADLRLIDRDGREIGYLVAARGEGAEDGWRDAELSEAGLVPGGEWQVVADLGDRGALHDTVEITLASGAGDTFYWVEVSASGDRRSWRVVRQKAPLYHFEGDGLAGPVTISYPQTRDRWLRLGVADVEEAPAIDRLRVAERGGDERSGIALERGLIVDAESPEGETRFIRDGSFPGMPIVGVRVATERDEFHRPVVVDASDDGTTWRSVGRGQLYRVRREGGGDERREALELEFPRASAAYWRVSVLNRGDRPIDDLEVRLLRLDQRIVFRAPAGGTPRLLYGNHTAAAPAYELARLVTRDQASSARSAGLLGEEENLAYRSPEPFTERHPLVLWAALGLAVVVLSVLALRSLR